MARKALVISPEPPYPMHGGGPIRTVSLIEYLRREYTVDLVLFRDGHDLEIPRERFGDILEIPLPFHSKSLPAKLWRNLSRLIRRASPLTDRFSGFGTQLETWLSGRGYDLIVVEHFWTAPYVDLLKKHGARVVCDLHNIESELLQHLAPVFVPATQRLERNLLPRFDTVLVSSEADAGRASIPTVVYPNAIPSRQLPVREEKFAIAMSGNFDFPPNAQGRRWFETHVWPKLKSRFPGLEWRLIGKGANPVDDAVSELARTQVAVVPIFAGSGTRLKILEAWSAGTPVVSTPLGAEGLGAIHGVELLLAETPQAFADCITDLLENREMREKIARSARLRLEEHFTWPIVWEKLRRSGTL